MRFGLTIKDLRLSIQKEWTENARREVVAVQSGARHPDLSLRQPEESCKTRDLTFCEEGEFVAFLGKCMGENNLDAAGIFYRDKHVISHLQQPQTVLTVTSERGASNNLG
jgi:hypothetical protein